MHDLGLLFFAGAIFRRSVASVGAKKIVIAKPAASRINEKNFSAALGEKIFRLDAKARGLLSAKDRTPTGEANSRERGGHIPERRREGGITH